MTAGPGIYDNVDPVSQVCIRVEKVNDLSTVQEVCSEPGVYAFYSRFVHEFQVSAGHYKVTYWAGDDRNYVPKTTMWTVTFSQDASFTVLLALRSSISGTVFGERGLPAKGIEVELWQGDARLDATVTNSKGKYAFRDWPSGGYVLKIAQSRTYNAVTRVVTLSKDIKEYIELAGRRNIRGRIVLPVGAEMNGAVYLYSAETGDFYQSVQPEPNGDFTAYVSWHPVRIFFWGFDGAAAEWFDDGKTWGTSKYVSAPEFGRDLKTVSLARASSIAGVAEIPETFTGDTFCVTAWNAADSYFLDDYCGPAGEPFSFDYLPGTKLKLSLSDVDDNRVWLGGGWIGSRRIRTGGCRRTSLAANQSGRADRTRDLRERPSHGACSCYGR